MAWTAVVNPAAGRGRTRALLDQLTAALEHAGAEVHVSADADDGRRIAATAIADGRDVVACGGDGTVGEIAEVVAGTDATFAVVPTGTGNDFARAIGLDPKHALDAVALLASGRRERIDLGRIRLDDGTTAAFTTVANTGFDAEVNRWANDVTWATGTPVYVLGVLRTLLRYRPRPVRVRVDDRSWEGDAWLVAVGNSASYGGGMRIAPQAILDDGLLDVCVLGPLSVAELLMRFPTVFAGGHVRSPRVTMLRGASVEITSLDGDPSHGAADLWANGERVGPLPARIDVAPGALEVVRG